VFEVCDYMRGADPKVLEEYARTLFNRISGRGPCELYTDVMLTWLESPEFLRRGQPLYLERSRNLTLTHEGREHDLQDLYRSLVRQRLVSPRLADGAVFSWTAKPNRIKVGYCSTLMKVIAISSIMDDPSVPEFVSEYVLYHELLHLEDGLCPGNRHHGKAFQMREELHPKAAEAEAWLKRLATGKRKPKGHFYKA